MLQDFLEAHLWRRNIIPYPKPGICLTRPKMSGGQDLGETAILDPVYLTLPHIEWPRLSRLLVPRLTIQTTALQISCVTLGHMAY